MGRKDRSNKVPPAFDPAQLYRSQSRRFVLWLPVCLGIGVWLYFSADTEPEPGWTALLLVPLLAISTGLARRFGWAALAVCWIGFTVTAGFSLALLSARLADAPRIAFPIGETVEGRVIELSRSASGAPRMLLDDVTIYGVEPDDTPVRVRLTMLDHDGEDLPVPGQRIRVYATLMPTGEPVEPGAFDFRRRAFFERLGGVGLTRGHVLILPAVTAESPWDTARLWLARLRDSISRGLRSSLPGPQGAFAAAIIVGDRSDIEEEDAEALRASNLAHLLAISGLHMGILTGLVFALSRLVLAAIPWTAYHLPTKKMAAIMALFAGAAYLGLSGATVATQRAFIMVAVALTAVLFDRPAITLRALAVAAAIILAIRPISLLDAGFQMSFAATVALVAGYETLREKRFGMERKSPSWPYALALGLATYVGALLLSSLLAGGATAPIAAFHFNRSAPYGLLSNLLALPVMGFWIAPAACLAAVLAPLGLADLPLQAMGLGIEQVLWTAHQIADLPGAVQPVRAAPVAVLGLIALGGLWLALVNGRWRLLGLAGLGAGLVLWSTAPPRPDVLVAPQVGLSVC